MEEIIKTINSISGGYSNYQIFYDWVKMMAISLNNMTSLEKNEFEEKLEKEYLDLANKYKENINKFVKMTGLLTLELEKEMTDVLGTLYMKGGFGQDRTGQFFTPFHLSELVAKINKYPNKKVEMYEPSCGGGGMIIAAAKAMKEQGINYQNNLIVEAGDIDWMCVYMTYVQLSLLGIKAKVTQGNSLEYGNKITFYTPSYKGLI